MLATGGQQRLAELLVMLLAKRYVLLELSMETCAVCHKALTHDAEGPICLAWSMLSPEQQHNARAAIRALALSIGNDESLADPLVH